MVLNLSQHQKNHLKDVFGLSYHITYLDLCSHKIPLKGLDVLEIGGALPASLVIDHLGCNSWTSVEAPSYDEELGEANQFWRNHAETYRLQELKERYRHYCLNVEDLDSDHYGQYDLIFSIACFEHINRLPLALRKMLLCLKPGGRLFTMYSPIWSAYDGHHLPIAIPDRFDTQLSHQSYIFRPWGHLLQNREQVFADICSRFDTDFADEVIYSTWNTTHINRYFSEDYRIIFEHSGFELLEYHETYLYPPMSEIQAELESRFPGYKQFSNNGIYAILRKPYSEVIIF